jgi:hypothetical protein
MRHAITASVMFWILGTLRTATLESSRIAAMWFVAIVLRLISPILAAERHARSAKNLATFLSLHRRVQMPPILT